MHANVYACLMKVLTALEHFKLAYTEVQHNKQFKFSSHLGVRVPLQGQLNTAYNIVLINLDGSRLTFDGRKVRWTYNHFAT